MRWFQRVTRATVPRPIAGDGPKDYTRLSDLERVSAGSGARTADRAGLQTGNRFLICEAAMRAWSRTHGGFDGIVG